MADISQIQLGNTTYNIKDTTARTRSLGKITSNGDITTNTSIVSGDRLVINDESNSEINNSSITFGTNSNQYLANDGTWQTITSQVEEVSIGATQPTDPNTKIWVRIATAVV